MKTKKLISTTILVVILALAVLFIKNNLKDFKQLIITNPINIIYIIIISLIVYLVLGVINKELLKPLNVNINLKESTLISLVNSFYNLITPFRGGIATRAYYLKKKYNLQYTKFLGLVATSTLLVILISSILGIIATIIIYQKENYTNPIIPLIFLATFILTLSIAIISPTLKETKHSFINKFIRVINSFSEINKNKSFYNERQINFLVFAVIYYKNRMASGIFSISFNF